MQSVLHKVIGPEKVEHDLNGRVALITGGADGIGFEIAKAFALQRARVIMVNRKEDHGEIAIEKIKKEKADAKIEFVGCDLSILKEVKEVFSGIREREERLDLLVLSAGINANQYGETHDGIDRHFGINWLGNFYAINQLYPLLRKTSKLPNVPAPRIVFESSEMHRGAPPNTKFESIDELNDPEMNKRTGPVQLYGRTKLAMILGAKQIRDRVAKTNGDNIYAMSVHPGAVNTDMQDQWAEAYPGVLGSMLKTAMVSIGRDPEQGAYSGLYACTSPEIEEKNYNGYYFTDPGQLGKESSQASDERLGASLWSLSEKIIKEKVGPDALQSWDA